jgi:hypothetical protein
MQRKRRFTFMIDHEMLRRLRDAQSRTGLSVGEQVRVALNGGSKRMNGRQTGNLDHARRRGGISSRLLKK